MPQSFESKASQEETAAGRRRLLKILSAGGVAASAAPILPTSWTRPVIDTVVLPAHAQLSVVPPLNVSASAGTGPFTCGGGGETGPINTDGTPGGAFTLTISITPDNAGDQFFVSNANANFSGTLNGTGQAFNTGTQNLSLCGLGGTPTPGATGTATVTVTETATGRSGSLTYSIANP